jgi:hypothetical protein
VYVIIVGDIMIRILKKNCNKIIPPRYFKEQKIVDTLIMKNLFFTLFILLDFGVYSQKLDMSNINYDLLDSLIFVQVNHIRDSLGRNTVHFSKLMRDNVSKVQTKKMLDAKKCYHPERGTIITDIQQKVFSNVQKLNPNLNVKKDGDLNNMTMEVCIITGYITDCKTYQEMSKKIVDRWCTSEPHKMVLEYYGKDKYTFNGRSQQYLVGSSSSKLGDYQGSNCIYSSFHIGIVYIKL